MKRVDYARKYNKQWDHDNQTWMERRSKLEKVIMFLLVLTGCGFIGLFAYHSAEHDVGADSCTSRNCLLTASQIATHIDPDTNPCEDFVGFACGNFKKNMQESSRKTIANLVQRQLKEIIEEPINEEDHYMINKQKEWYQKCMNETDGSEESLETFKADLQELNGWPVVVGHSWIAKHFVWQDLIFGLRRKGYPFSMLLDVDVIPDPLGLNQFIVTVKPPSVDKINSIYENVYKTYMVKVALSFESQPKLAQYEMDDVFEFINNLTKIADRNTFEGSKETEQRLTVQQFQDHHNQIDWLGFINGILHPSANISQDDVVVFPTNYYVKSFFYLLHRTPRRVQANYIIWKVLEEIAPFLSNDLKLFGSNYTCLTNKPSVSRHELCKRVIYENLYLPPSDVLYARKYLSVEKGTAVGEILTNVKMEFVKSLNESLQGGEVVEKADSILEVVGMQGDFYNNTIFDIYDSFNFTSSNNDSDGFLNLLLEISRLHKDFIYSRSYTPLSETPRQSASQLRVEYSSIDNTVVVPAGILQDIFYDEDAPMFSNYGSLGSMIAYELVLSFIIDESDSVEGWLNDTRTNLFAEMGCSLENLEEWNSTTNSSEVEKVITTGALSEYVALEVADRAYQYWVEGHEEEAQLAGIDYSVDQMFWIFSVLPHCYKLSSKGPNGATLNPNFRYHFSCPSEETKNCPILP